MLIEWAMQGDNIGLCEEVIKRSVFYAGGNQLIIWFDIVCQDVATKTQHNFAKDEADVASTHYPDRFVIKIKPKEAVE